METTEVAKVIKFLNASWPSQALDKATAAVWGSKLMAYDYDAIMGVLDRLIETSKFRPSLAEIIGPLRSRGPSADDAFANVLDQIEAHPRVVSAIEEEVVRRLGGWDALGRWRRDDVHFRRREFVEVYNSLLESQRGIELLALGTGQKALEA